MKDKDKIIKEMAKDIPYLTLDRTVFVGATETKNVSWMLSEEDNKVIAESLVAKGWVKPPEDSVVLTREKYEKLQQSYIVKAYDKLRAENKELLKIKENCLEIIKQGEEQILTISKETSEKIILPEIEFCKALYGNCNSQTDEYKKGFTDCCRIIQMLLNDLAKQFGVEIKE